MPAFDDSDLYENGENGDRFYRLDVRLMQMGPISVVRSDATFEQTRAWLRDHGYLLAEVDCQNIRRRADLRNAVIQASPFDWPSRGLDKNQYLDLCHHIEAPRGGLAFLLDNFDAVMHLMSDEGNFIVDGLYHAAYDNLIVGRRLLTVVRVRSVRLARLFEQVGGHTPHQVDPPWLAGRRST